MNTDLQQWMDKLQAATLPEDVFGPADGTLRQKAAAIQTEYRRIAGQIHPDRFRDPAEQQLASEAFVRLQTIYQTACERIADGSFHAMDPSDDTILIQSPKHTYHLTGKYRSQNPITIYPAQCLIADRVEEVDVEIGPSDPIRNAADAFKRIQEQADFEQFSPYFSLPLETFQVQMGTSTYAASVFKTRSGWYSLADVAVQYPTGIDPRDMAWIFRRLLTALGFIHRARIVHGAIFPENILIEPEQHGLELIHFHSSVDMMTSGWSPTVYIPPGRTPWMPTSGAVEVLSGFDLYLAGLSMRFILGGEPTERTNLPGVPAALSSFLRGCALPNIAACPQDAWQVLQEFDQLIGQMWGERQFHPFKMAVTA